jgi:hypothetical protein
MQSLIYGYRPFVKLYLLIYNKYRLHKSLEVGIINDLGENNSLFMIKPDSLEKMQIMRIYGHIEGGEVLFTSPQIDLKRYSHATIFPFSDFILTQSGAIWHKRDKVQFTKITPLDRNLIEFSHESLYIRKPKKCMQIKNGYSLCGVHSTIWAHFIVQYLPKMQYIKQLQRKVRDEITIIIPEYKDLQIKQIVDIYLKGIDGINIYELREDESIICEQLYYVENLSIISDTSSYVSPSDVIIYNQTILFIKNHFVNNGMIFPEHSNDVTTSGRKLYIKRDGARNIENNQEIEEYFKQENFEFIAPHEYSLSEKKKKFRTASIIVGPASSGFTNIIFCLPGTKVMMFTNFQRSYDPYLSTIAHCFEVNLCAITGTDILPSSPHSSYRISLARIKIAYKDFIKA